jgi:hypothetical protein
MVKRMRKLGGKDFIYVADSALITPDNHSLINDREGGCLFLSRLPMTYNECRDAIARAVASEKWEEIGVISDQPETKNRKPASYKLFEAGVNLYERDYRVVAAHSDGCSEDTLLAR